MRGPSRASDDNFYNWNASRSGRAGEVAVARNKWKGSILSEYTEYTQE